MAKRKPDIDLDSLACEPTERERALESDRKAREAARQERERAGKSRRRPVLEEILADVVRVAEDEETNPYAQFRSVSRRRYEIYGHFPIEHVLEHGQFVHVKRMAGLEPAVGDRQLLRARTQRSLLEKDARYVSRYLQPHADKFPELRRATAGSRLTVFISDTHSLFIDPFTWLAFLAFIEDAQPDTVVWGGDHVDGSEISTHPKVPGHTLPLQEELDCLRGMWTEARSVAPRARFVWIESNHFMQRMVRYLTQNAPALSGLRCLRMDQLLELEDLEIDVVQPGTFLSPAGQQDKRPAVRVYSAFTATHGTRTGRFPANDELLQWADSGVSGHVHRDQIVRGPASGLRDKVWMCVPGGTIDEAAKYYVKGNYPAWSRGFGVIETHGPAIQMTPAITSHGVLMVNGFVYEQGRKLPSGVEPVRRFWRKRFGLPKKEAA